MQSTAPRDPDVDETVGVAPPPGEGEVRRTPPTHMWAAWCGFPHYALMLAPAPRRSLGRTAGTDRGGLMLGMPRQPFQVSTANTNVVAWRRIGGRPGDVRRKKAVEMKPSRVILCVVVAAT